jgi:hypothetical protein
MVVWLEIETWVIGKGGTKIDSGKVGGEVWRLLGFVALVCIWVYFFCCSGGYCVRDCRELVVCTVGTVG